MLFLRSPDLHCLLPGCAPRRVGTSLELLERDIVVREHSLFGAPFYVYVADRHPSFYAQAAHGRAAVLDEMTLTKRCSGPPDQPEHHVFGRHPERKLAFDGDRQVASSRLRQALRRQHQLDLGCADAKRQSAKCSM